MAEVEKISDPQVPAPRPTGIVILHDGEQVGERLTCLGAVLAELERLGVAREIELDDPERFEFRIAAGWTLRNTFD